ncbi:MAG: hypothetical protein HFJ45_09990 [Clostridia bacterium]|nr:hypothetical protein [Clostridia bacterium]
MKNRTLKLLVIILLVISIFTLAGCGDTTDTYDEEENKLSKKEAEELLEEYYDYARDLYWLKLFDISEEYNDEYMYEINDFEEVSEKYMTENAIEDLIDDAPLIYVEDGNYYCVLGGIAEYDENIEFSDIKVKSNKITATVTYDIIVADEVIEKDVSHEFSIVKNGKDWLIDEYTYFTNY